MDTEHRQYEYNFEGTKLESMPTVYVEARFDCIAEGENGDGSKFAEWEVTEFDCSFEGFGEDSCNDDFKQLLIYIGGESGNVITCPKLTSIYGIIEQFCYDQWDKE